LEERPALGKVDELADEVSEKLSEMAVAFSTKSSGTRLRSVFVLKLLTVVELVAESRSIVGIFSAATNVVLSDESMMNIRSKVF
jgi:hypothetical protein